MSNTKKASEEIVVSFDDSSLQANLDRDVNELIEELRQEQANKTAVPTQP